MDELKFASTEIALMYYQDTWRGVKSSRGSLKSRHAATAEAFVGSGCMVSSETRSPICCQRHVGIGNTSKQFEPCAEYVSPRSKLLVSGLQKGSLTRKERCRAGVHDEARGVTDGQLAPRSQRGVLTARLVEALEASSKLNLHCSSVSECRVWSLRFRFEV